jgi:hypothetical protein
MNQDLKRNEVDMLADSALSMIHAVTSDKSAQFEASANTQKPYQTAQFSQGFGYRN